MNKLCAPPSSSVWIYIWLQVHSKLRLSNFCTFFKPLNLHCMKGLKTTILLLAGLSLTTCQSRRGIMRQKNLLRTNHKRFVLMKGSLRKDKEVWSGPHIKYLLPTCRYLIWKYPHTAGWKWFAQGWKGLMYSTSLLQVLSDQVKSRRRTWWWNRWGLI